MKQIKYYSLLMIAAFFAACDHHGIDDLSFGVSLQNAPDKIYAGDEVTFLFDGNPDYIVFYSGENGNKYANKDRLKVEVEQFEISYSVQQQYTDEIFQNKPVLFAYVSEDFNGDYSIEGINKATWTQVSGDGENQLAVPVPSGRAQNVDAHADFSEWKDKKFYFAFRYHLEAHTAYPRVDINPLSMIKKMDGAVIEYTNPKTEWGFNMIFVSTTSGRNYNIEDAVVRFQPVSEHSDKEVDVWAISQLIDPGAVYPDNGNPIKSTDYRLSSYTHIYPEPGEYTVSFVATNANLWNSDSILRELKMTVKPADSEEENQENE